MKALLSAQSQLGVKPRILGVPGHDNKAVATELLSVAQSCVGLLTCQRMAARRYRRRSLTVKTSASAKGC